MTKLKKLFVLLPLLLMAAVNDVWADITVTVRESVQIGTAGGGWGAAWISNNDDKAIFEFANIGDEVIITETKSDGGSFHSPTIGFGVYQDLFSNLQRDNSIFSTSENGNTKTTTVKIDQCTIDGTYHSASDMLTQLKKGLALDCGGPFNVKVQIRLKKPWTGADYIQEWAPNDASKSATFSHLLFKGLSYDSNNPGYNPGLCLEFSSNISQWTLALQIGDYSISNNENQWHTACYRYVNTNDGKHYVWVQFTNEMMETLQSASSPQNLIVYGGGATLIGAKFDVGYDPNSGRGWTPVSGLELSDDVNSTNNSSTATITYTLSPSSPTYKRIHWESSNTNVATVSTANTDNSASGTVTVTFLQNEDVTITATPWDNRGAKQTITFSKYIAPVVTTNQARVFWTREGSNGIADESKDFSKEPTIGVWGDGAKEVIIYKELFADAQPGDILKVELKTQSNKGNHGIYLKTTDGTEFGGYITALTSSRPKTVALTDDLLTHLKGDGARDLRVIGYSGSKDGSWAYGTFTVEITLSRDGVDLFQIPCSEWVHTNPPSGTESTTDAGVLRFDDILFKNKFIKKNDLYESWNPGLWFRCEPQTGYGTTIDSKWDPGFEGMAIRIISLNGSDFNKVEHEFTNNLGYYKDASIRFKGGNKETSEFWIQFPNEVIDDLNTNRRFVDVAGFGTLKILDVDFDFGYAGDPNPGRNWTVAGKVKVSYNGTVGTHFTVDKSANSSISLNALVRNSNDTEDCNLQNVHWTVSDPSIVSFAESIEKSTDDKSGNVTLYLKDVGRVTLTALPWDNRSRNKETGKYEALATITLDVIGGAAGYTLKFIDVDVNHDGSKIMNRTYAVRNADRETKGDNLPIIISLHGASNDYDNGRPDFNWRADNNYAVVVYPRGLKRSMRGGMERGWEATDDNGMGNEDPEFISAIIDHVAENPTQYGANSVDLSKVYVAGFSNGGMMAYWIGDKLGDKVAAISSIGGIPANEFHLRHAGVRPMPFLHIHGGQESQYTFDLTEDGGKYNIDILFNNMKLRNGTIWNPMWKDASGNWHEWNDANRETQKKISTIIKKWNSSKVNSDGSTGGHDDISTEYYHYKWEALDAKAITKDLDNDEPGTAGTDFEYIHVAALEHSPSGGWGTGNFDVANTMWDFFMAHPMPVKTAGKYNNGWSTLKFRADLTTDARGQFDAAGNKYYHESGYSSSKELLRYECIGNTGTSEGGNRNMYKSLQFETFDNNHDGIVQGFHRMRLNIKGGLGSGENNTTADPSYITVRLKDINTGEIVLYKRFKADTRTKTTGNGGDTNYGTAQWKEIRTNFTVPLGWHEYELLIDKGNETDQTYLDFVEFASGSFTTVEDEEPYNPENLPSLHNMNLIYQPKFGNINGGVAKSYIPIAQINPKYGREANEKGDTKDYTIDSNWTSATSETTVSTTAADNYIKIGDYITHRDAGSSTDAKEAYVRDNAQNSNVVAFLCGTHTEMQIPVGGGEAVEVTVDNNYTLRPMPVYATTVDGETTYDRHYGLNLAQYGQSGMAAFANNPTAIPSTFPTKATFVMKASGTVDITMLVDNINNIASCTSKKDGNLTYSEQQGYAICVYYMNGEQHEPKKMATYVVRGHAGEDAYDNTYNGTAITASVRMQHLGADGTCTVFFCYEGIDSGSKYTDGKTKGEPIYSNNTNNDLWVKGFVVKRPDLKVTVGRTDRKYYESWNNNTHPTAYGENNPYRWIFKGSGFNGRETFNTKDYRTYLCGYVDGDPTKTLVYDHLLVYSENESSRAHFVGYDKDEHLQFDTPTQFRYDGYGVDSEGTITIPSEDINYDLSGQVFDPIVNDGLKVNVTGSGWFKVRARVPGANGQHKVKMTIMTAVNGGTEHIKLLRYFKLPADGRYHDYVAYLKASVYEADKKDFDKKENNGTLSRAKRLADEQTMAEKTQQSLFVVFEDIGDDESVTIPAGVIISGTNTTKIPNTWDGNDNHFQVDLECMEWLNDDVPDYVYQRGQYLFRSQTENELVEGHDANRELRRRQTVYGKGQSSATTPILYWQAGGAHRKAAVLLNYSGETWTPSKSQTIPPVVASIVNGGNVYMENGLVEVNMGTEESPDYAYYMSYKKVTSDNALEDGRWAYDTNWMLVSGGTNPKYASDGNYTHFGMIPDRSSANVQAFGGHWDMAAMPTLGLQSYITDGGASHPNVDGIFYTSSSKPSPLWQGAHTEMQSPRVNSSITDNKYRWTSAEEYNPTGSKTEFDLPVSGPFYRFMPMKNVKITAYVVPGNATGKIYVLDDTGNILKTNAEGTREWLTTGSVFLDDTNLAGASIVNGVITPATGSNNGGATRAKTIKITISARAGKEYFLTSTGMALGVATMYFDEIAEEQVPRGTALTLSDQENVTNIIDPIFTNRLAKYRNVTLNRKFQRGKWYSLILPFSMNEEKFIEVFGEDAQCLHFEKIDDNYIYLLHHKYNMITAGRPVFVKTGSEMELNSVVDGKGNAKTITDVTIQTNGFSDVVVDGSSNKGAHEFGNYAGSHSFTRGDEEWTFAYGIKASYDPTTMEAGSIVMSTSPKDNKYAGQLAYMSEVKSTRGMRSWIRFEASCNKTTQNAPLMGYASFNYTGDLLDEDDITGIENLLKEEMGVNIMNKSDKVYDLNGRVVSTGANMDALPSGIYIVNGKKFVK